MLFSNVMFKSIFFLITDIFISNRKIIFLLLGKKTFPALRQELLKTKINF